MDLSPPITPADLKLILLPQKLTTSPYSTIWTGKAVRDRESERQAVTVENAWLEFGSLC